MNTSLASFAAFKLNMNELIRFIILFGHSAHPQRKAIVIICITGHNDDVKTLERGNKKYALRST